MRIEGHWSEKSLDEMTDRDWRIFRCAVLPAARATCAFAGPQCLHTRTHACMPACTPAQHACAHLCSNTLAVLQYPHLYCREDFNTA